MHSKFIDKWFLNGETLKEEKSHMPYTKKIQSNFLSIQTPCKRYFCKTIIIIKMGMDAGVQITFYDVDEKKI